MIASKFFDTLADLKSQAGGRNGLQVLLNGLGAVNDGDGGTYMWDSTSTVADDGFKVVQVTGVTTGRWVRLGNSNTIKGSTTFSSVTLVSSYTIGYGRTLPFVPLTVIICPRSLNAALPSWVDNITNTSFRVNFTSVPVLGTLNMAIDYIVVKQ